jgi:curved DNA-binding protein CbpA
VTFYDFLGVSPSASHDDIVKAQRKKSRTLHPDKIKQSFIAAKSTAKPKKKKAGEKSKPGVHVSKGPSEREVQATVKKATERYQRLTVVANILKGEGRARYDHFLNNGFPTWRGTGYYYKRFRPGLGTVLLGLFIAGGGGAHYGALVLSWKRQREFVDRYIRHARRAAWGDETGIKGIPGLDGSAAAVLPPAEEPETGAMQMNRRQKRQMEKEQRKEKLGKGAKRGGSASGTQTPTDTSAPTGERKRVQAENGKILIVDSIGNVFLEEQDEDGTQEFLLDMDEIPRPTIRDTALYRFPLWIYRKAVGSLQKAPLKATADGEVAATSVVEPEEENDSGSSFEVLETSGVEQSANGSTKKRNKKSRK